MTPIQKAAGLMAERLRIFRKLAAQAKERGEEFIELHPDEFWDAEDERALAAFEDAVPMETGQRPLFE